MRFNDLVKKINPKIKGIAYRLDGKYTSFGEDDLYQQALICLWQKYQRGELQDKTESYVVQGCSYEMRNYIRKNFKGIDRKSTSAYIQVNDQGDCLMDFLPAKTSDAIDATCNTNMLLEQIREKLSDRENTVLDMTAEGLTTREIGKELGVSHVMIVKIKKKIRQKCQTLGLKVSSRLP